MACCICHGPIKAPAIDAVEGAFGLRFIWPKDYDAEPVATGRCCENCHDTVVEPARGKESS